MQRSRLGSAIPDTDFDENVFWGMLRVFHENIKIPVAIEDPRIQQFVLEIVARPLPVRGHQFVVGKCPLRIFVEVLHVRVGRRAVEVEVILLHILPVIAFTVRQSE